MITPITPLPEPEALAPAHLAATSRALARAFRDNAGFVAALRGDTASRERQLVRVMRSFAATCARAGDAAIVRRGDEVLGAALAYPPGAYPLGLGDWIRNGLGALSVGLASTVRAARLDRYMARRHLTAPHWYLFVLGVDPDRQGSGVGGALLRRLGARADAQRVDSFLETDEEKNVGLYRRHGYEVVEEGVTPLGFRMWHMLRAPRP